MDLTEDLPFQVLRRTWQPVALSRELGPAGVIGFRLLNTDIVVARFEDGSLLAADDVCPHKGARLSRGTILAGELQCPYHGWRFDPAGACTNIPSLLNPPSDKLELSHLNAYAVQERYGMVWVQLERNADVRLPDVPEFENPRWTYLLGPPTPFRSGWRREVENYLDMTHFAFAHGTTLGKAADSVVPPMKITVFDDGSGFQMDAPFPALESPHEQPGKLQSAHGRQQRCWLPNFTTIRQTFGDGDARVLVHVPTPVTREECVVFWSLALSPGFDGPAPEDQLEFAIRVLDEDRTMCENQVPREIPINPSKGGWGVLVTPGDTLANTFQKCLRKYLQAVQAGGESVKESRAAA
ncbi:MAG: aromatic ring-hydroxylating dioxygenase subunit alpha [Terrimicrobiaceae bacterium]|nr:aromatic ring-hydroxylating dioxygenase subunit alpha [Terrimicrobiaceae bacterium]